MPELFTASLAQVLAHDTGHEVREGSHRLALTPRSVTLIPGGRDGIIAPCQSGGYELRLAQMDGNLHPCANALFESAALVATAPAGIVLTGMGEDGAKGTSALRRKDVPVLVQDPASCIVGGMPQAACAAAPGCEVLSIVQIAARIETWFSKAGRRNTGRPSPQHLGARMASELDTPVERIRRRDRGPPRQP